jgi:uncharacterized protein
MAAMNRHAVLALAALIFAAAPCLAQSVAPAIYTDPPADSKNPAAMAVLHIPSGGVSINGVLYSPPGAAAHPTLVICHGLPGNEKNLDLAQAVRRAGWNAVTFNYRGSWGSAGKFRFAQNPQDAAAVLKFLRDPSNAAKFHIDTHRIVLAGHSMGGWVTAQTAAHDQGLIGAILISMGDMGAIGRLPHDKATALMADNMEALAGVTAESMAAEAAAHQKAFSATSGADGLVHTPLLVLTANDDLKPDSDALVAAIKAKGGAQITEQHVATDHAWSDHRIALEGIIIKWLAALP